MAKGAVATCATRVVARVPVIAERPVPTRRPIRPAPGRTNSRPSISRAQAISPATAPKDIWKLGPSRPSGSRASAISAARARLRIDRAGRSTRIAPSMIRVMISERSAAMSQPEKAQ